LDFVRDKFQRPGRLFRRVPWYILGRYFLSLRAVASNTASFLLALFRWIPVQWFSSVQNEARRLGASQSISVSIPSDEEGYSDRECPSSECLFQFKVHEEDWQDKLRDKEMFCPFCGHTADSDKWWTTEQVEYMEKAALQHLEQRLGSAMKRDADRWNRRQSSNSFIRITMKVDNRPRILLPFVAAEAMRLKITCPECACRYAVIGAAFFCPSCGHNAAELVFSQSLTGIRNALDALAPVRAAIPDKDTAETTVRLIIENGLQNAVTAFQRYAEALYARQPAAPKARRNAFQNLTEGSDLWHAVFGKRYSDYLDAAELAALTRAFQQRHLLAHTQGLVDQDYIARSGDTAYRPGMRLVIREITVRECIKLIEKLASSMIADI
jgi:uncharacterized Zn finger protein (UPF0148 family)